MPDLKSFAIKLCLLLLYFLSNPLLAKSNHIDSKKAIELAEKISNAGYTHFSQALESLDKKIRLENNYNYKVFLLKLAHSYSNNDSNPENNTFYLNQLKEIAVANDDSDTLFYGTAMQLLQGDFANRKIEESLEELNRIHNLYKARSSKRQQYISDYIRLRLLLRDKFPAVENQIALNSISEIGDNPEYRYEKYLLLGELRSVDLSEQIENSNKFLDHSLKHNLIANTAVMFFYLIRLADLSFDKELTLLLAKKYYGFVDKNNIKEEKYYANTVLGDAYLKLNNFLKAKKHYENALPYLPDLAYWNYIYNVKFGLIEANLGNISSAKKYHELSSSLLKQTSGGSYKHDLNLLKGEILLLDGNIFEGKKLLEKYWNSQLEITLGDQAKKVKGIRGSLQKVIDEEKNQKKLAEFHLKRQTYLTWILSFVVISSLILLNRYLIAARSLKKANLHLQLNSEIDSLTKLYNRGYWDQRIREEFEALKQKPNSHSMLVLLDIDHFKAINDQFGHQIGDQVIKHLANLLKEFSRKQDIVGRYGGEEFAMLLVNTDIHQAKNICELIRIEVEKCRMLIADNEIKYTISLGIADYNHKLNSENEWINRADTALYESKRTGRNLTSIWS